MVGPGTLCWNSGPEKLGQSHCCGFASIAHVSLILCMLCHSTGGTQCWQHHQPDLHCSLIFTLQIPAGCHRSWDRGLCLHVTVAGLSDIPLKYLWKQPCATPHVVCKLSQPILWALSRHLELRASVTTESLVRTQWMYPLVVLSTQGILRDFFFNETLRKDYVFIFLFLWRRGQSGSLLKGPPDVSVLRQ